MSPLDSGLAPSTGAPAADAEFARDVRAGLAGPGQKRLPPKYFYDSLGTTLFEAITQLPEYGLWRAERDLLTRHRDEIAERIPATSVIELGSGSANKTRHLMETLVRRRPVRYAAIDISAAALAMTARELDCMPGLTVETIEDEYESGLETALGSAASRGPTLVLVLGSSLGNLDAPSSRRFLQRIGRALAPGDGLLLGADLEKPVERLLAAYDDALGVTAAFNLNLLARMNRELGADFRIDRFRHRVRFDPDRHNVEMHLESMENQAVSFAGIDMAPVRFRCGETIHTENSHKYTTGELDELLAAGGFRRAGQWLDEAWLFSSSLFVVP